MNRRSLVLGLAATPLAGPLAARSDALDIRDLYHEEDGLTEAARAIDGERVEVGGYMAPPLRADTRFFVLAAIPMSICPFCEEGAEWPSGILPVTAKRPVEVVPFWARIVVSGRFVTGRHVDPETEFFSLMRLEDAVFTRL